MRPAILVLAFLALASPALASEEFTVTTVGTQFVPAALAVPAGSVVAWEGVLFPHTVTTAADAGAALQQRPNDAANVDGDPDSFHAPLPSGGTLRHTFAEAGTFSYFCQLHRGMIGTVAVVEP